MTTKRNPIDKISVYISAGLVSGSGVLLLNVLPLFFGALSERFGLSESQLGALAFAMNAGFGIIGLSSLLWLHRISWRIISALASILVGGTLIYMTYNLSYYMLLVTMGVIGFGTGALYALAMTIFGDSSEPERALGFKLGIETIPGALLLIVLPITVIPSWGFNGMIITIAAALVLMGTLPLPWVPRKSERQLHSSEPPFLPHAQSRVIVWLGLIASLIFLTGIMAIWAFLELIGRKTGLSSKSIGTILAFGFIINAAGGGAVSLISRKVGSLIPVTCIILIKLIGLLALAQFSSLTTYATGVIFFLFSINFVLAYTFGIIAEFDLSGKLIALGALCISIGAALGPATSGFLIEKFGYISALYFSGGCSIIALVFFGVAVLKSQKHIKNTHPKLSLNL